jgi:hypothetical protein
MFFHFATLNVGLLNIIKGTLKLLDVSQKENTAKHASGANQPHSAVAVG